MIVKTGNYDVKTRRALAWFFASSEGKGIIPNPDTLQPLTMSQANATLSVKAHRYIDILVGQATQAYNRALARHYEELAASVEEDASES